VSFLFGSAKPNFKLKNQDISKMDPSPALSALERRRRQLEEGGADLVAGPNRQDYAPTGGTHVARATPTALPEFEKARGVLRRDLQGEAKRESDSQGEALQRRFAAIGGLSSGAYIKQAGIMQDDIARQKEDALERGLTNLGVKEAEAIRGIDEAERGREFQSQEQGRSFLFQGQRDYTQALQQSALFNATARNNFKQQLFDADSKIYALDLAWREAQQRGAQEEFNAEMALFQARQDASGIFG